MKHFVQSLLVVWFAAQGLACAGADPSAEENDETPAAFEVAPEDGAVAAHEGESDADQAPHGIALLSPDERDAELDELTGPRGTSLADVLLQARLLDAGLHNVQVVDPTREAGLE